MIARTSWAQGSRRPRSSVKCCSPPAPPCANSCPARSRTAAAERRRRAARVSGFSSEADNGSSVLLQVPPLHAEQRGGSGRAVGGVVTSGFLGLDLDVGVGGNELGRNRHPLDDLDPGLD